MRLPKSAPWLSVPAARRFELTASDLWSHGKIDRRLEKRADPEAIDVGAGGLR